MTLADPMRAAVRFAALLTYLISWIVLAIAAVAGAIPRAAKDETPFRMTRNGVIGTIAQALSIFLAVGRLGEGPLRPTDVEMLTVLALAPLSAILFLWAQFAAPPSGGTLITKGPYALVRHPIYLAFLLMLIATGCIVSAGYRLLAAIGLYVVGTELRVASEENEMRERFGSQFVDYCRRTSWRYLPPLR